MNDTFEKERRVRARNFKYKGDRFIVRLEDEFFVELKRWADAQNVSVSALVNQLYRTSAPDQNRSANLRSSILRKVVEDRDQAKTKLENVFIGIESVMEALPNPVFSLEENLIKNFNSAFDRYIRQKLRFPPSLTMKLVVRNPADDQAIKASIVLPGFVLPILCRQLPVSWSDFQHYVIIK